MTIQLPQPAWRDRLLMLMGKRRAVYIPDTELQFGFGAYLAARKEPFLRALRRKKGTPLDKVWIFMDTSEGN